MLLLVVKFKIANQQNIDPNNEAVLKEYADKTYGYRVWYPCDAECIKNPPEIFKQNAYTRNSVDLPTFSTTTAISFGVFSEQTIKDWSQFLINEKKITDPNYVIGDGVPFDYSIKSIKKALLNEVGSHSYILYEGTLDMQEQVRVIEVGNTKGLEIKFYSSKDFLESKLIFVPLKNNHWLEIWIHFLNEDYQTIIGNYSKPILDSLFVNQD